MSRPPRASSGATFDDTLEDEIRVTVIATGFEDATLNAEAGVEVQIPAQPVNAPAFTPVRPASNRERPQGLFTGAAEKAAAAQPAAQPAAPAAQAPAQGTKSGTEEDPFDSIFKIFNNK